MNIHDYNKWMGMPKFKAWIVEVDNQLVMMQIKFGHLDTNEVVNVCFQIPEQVEHLAIKVEDALNSLLKSFYIPKDKGVDHAIEEGNIESNDWK